MQYFLLVYSDLVDVQVAFVNILQLVEQVIQTLVHSIFEVSLSKFDIQHQSFYTKYPFIIQVFVYDFFTFQFQIQDLTRLLMSIKFKLKWSTIPPRFTQQFIKLSSFVPLTISAKSKFNILSQSQYIIFDEKPFCLFQILTSLSVLLQIQLTVKSILFALSLSLWINDIIQHCRSLCRF